MMSLKQRQVGWNVELDMKWLMEAENQSIWYFGDGETD